jgi:hypothetical protein
VEEFAGIAYVDGVGTVVAGVVGRREEQHQVKKSVHDRGQSLKKTRTGVDAWSWNEAQLAKSANSRAHVGDGGCCGHGK